MVEVHTGICGDHLGGKNLTLKIIRQGLYWPIIQKDCEEYVRKCQACQLHGNVDHRPTTNLNSILAPCPFFQWGIDILGPFPKSKNQCQYIVVAVDYATKWVEAKPLSKIREKEMIEFFMEYMVFRFGVPRILVSDNGTQTTPRSSTGETPFRLAYGIEAVLPVEISLIFPRLEVFDPSLALEGVRFHNDLLEETREESRLRMIAQQEKTANYFNKKVRSKLFKVGDLVLRDSAASQPTITGKLKPTWEGPYRVSKVVSTGTYELSYLEGQPIKNAWNDIHLKKYYQ
ncbi:uncharacterized protein LOC141706461 [Apium graveolens]|uniref:uncharacterized protein LOC141706461 n=1 Tax=Apium graveolens TaxID=4045 RepID=UPI003D7B233E